jgi:outer membrane protein OmpA-like peptidoglycan-associated protein
MKTPALIGLLLLFTISNGPAWAQLSTRNKKAIEYYTQADNYRVREQYTQAIALLEQAIARDKNFAEAYFRMGLVYKTLRDFNQSNQNFETGLSLTREINKQKGYFFELGDNYLRQGDYAKALAHLDHFLGAESVNKEKIVQATLLKRNAEYGLRNTKSQSSFRPRPLDATVNAFAMQYFPVLTADEQKLIFTRRLGSGSNDDEDLVIAEKGGDGKWKAPESISPIINSRYNEGTCTISADGRKLIFTSCIGRRGYGHCDLFLSEKIGDVWSEPLNLGPEINSAAWESQPSLSADGRILYFVSDRRGGEGALDIYVSRLTAEGKWQPAESLGPSINTPFSEMSPFIHANGRTLFFATKGRPGFGGFDIFRSELEGGKWQEPVNFGSPINNHEDQFSLFISADSKTGYYSHEDATRLNSARLYEMLIPVELRIKYGSNIVKGIVRDKKTNQPLKSRVELYDLVKNELVSIVNSDSVYGDYLMTLTKGSDYGLYVTAPDYLFQSLNFNYENEEDPQPVVIDIYLEKTDAGATSVLNNIFFEFDKFELKEKSKTELDKVIRFLKESPDVQVEIGGHTDSDGSAAYNQQLSLKRAQAVVDYLANNEIDPGRLIQKGYGSEKPIRPNDTEENKQANRRIEFKIIR